MGGSILTKKTKQFSGYPESVLLDLGGTQREHGSKVLKNSNVKRILVFK